MNTKREYISFLTTFSAFFIAIICLKYSYLSTPFFYEEKPYTISSVNDYPLIDILTHNYKPDAFAEHHTFLPLIFSLPAKVFGDSPFTVHLTMLFFSILGLTFLVKTLQFLAPTKKNIYWIIPIFLMAYPDYFIHMSGYRYDIFAASMAIMTIYFHLKGKLLTYFFSGLLLSQTRETVIAFYASFILIDIIKYLRTRDSRSFKFILSSLINSFLWFSLFLANYINIGKFSASAASGQINKTIGGYLKILAFDLKWYFVSDLRWIYSLISIITLIWVYKRKETLPFELLYFVFPIIFYCLGMSFHVFEATYYLYPTIYLIYGLFIYFILKLNLNTFIYIALIPLLYFQFSYLNSIKAKEIMKEDSTHYTKVTDNYIELANYLQTNHSGKTINAEWPIVYYFRDPFFGYVKKPIKMIDHRFSKAWASQLGHDKENIIPCEQYRKNFKLVAIIKHGNGIQRKHQEYQVKECNYQEIKFIGNEDVWAKVFQRVD